VVEKCRTKLPHGLAAEKRVTVHWISKRRNIAKSQSRLDPLTEWPGTESRSPSQPEPRRNVDTAIFVVANVAKKYRTKLFVLDSMYALESLSSLHVVT